MKKLPKVLPYRECLELFSKAKKIRDKMLLQFLFYCGLRVSECIHVKKEDLDLKEGVLKVVQGKGGNDRLVPIPKPLMMDLKNWFALEPKEEEELLFKISRVRVHVIIKELNPNIHAHTLRHSYATHIYEKRGDIRMVQTLLGHKNIGTTSIYTHLSTKMKKKTIDEVFEWLIKD